MKGTHIVTGRLIGAGKVSGFSRIARRRSRAFGLGALLLRVVQEWIKRRG